MELPMKTKTLVKPTLRSFVRLSTAAALLSGVTTICAPVALADITFEDRGERFSLDVRDEPIADVMDKLSERFDFKVDGYPEHWSDEPMSFSATGDLERVLRSLLKDTSHVFEYHTDAKTRTTRIASLKLLNEGVEGFVPSQISSNGTADSPTAPGAPTNNYGRAGSGNPTLASPRDTGLDDNLQNGDLPTNPASAASTQNNGPGNAAGIGSTRSSGLSQTLEARARQSSGTATASTSGSTSAGATSNSNNPATGVSDADMQALTQRALQDVQGLADALRKAEGN